MTNFMSMHTHIPVLAAAVARTTGLIIEAGAGWGSTPMLHAMAKATGRALHTYDSDEKWLEKFRPLANGYTYHYLWNIKDLWESNPHNCGVLFCDFAPGETRKDMAIKYKKAADFVVCHDSETDYASGGNYMYNEAKEHFKYVEEYRYLRPYTLILSNRTPFGLGEFEKHWTPPPEVAAAFPNEK